MQHTHHNKADENVRQDIVLKNSKNEDGYLQVTWAGDSMTLEEEKKKISIQYINKLYLLKHRPHIIKIGYNKIY